MSDLLPSITDFDCDKLDFSNWSINATIESTVDQISNSKRAGTDYANLPELY